MNVLVAGGTGFVGRRLVESLVARGDVVTVVSRDPSLAQRHGPAGASYRGWLPPLDAYDGVVNLSGANLFGRRWNAEVKRELRESRLGTTRRLVEAIAAAHDPPRVLVNASAVGFYGDRGDEPLPETATPGTDFLAQVCREWEAEAQSAPGRVVVARLGVVLGP
ncbi:MAG TPA: NAD-dependent epimerase/dehydratase family protein, partial [Planctomycetota bacterium]|nr:NAD-dependent epimerase/dehydratase family protein [Planctomycetota bacterium]